MIDRGISEEYLVYWLDLYEQDRDFADRIEKCMRSARRVARAGAGKRSLIAIYADAYACFRSPVLAAEYLRRALQELAEPTPVDDSLPPPDSPVWIWIRERWFWRTP